MPKPAKVVPCTGCSQPVTDFRRLTSKVCLDCCWRKFVTDHGVTVLNHGSFAIAIKGPRYGQPQAGETIRIRCVDCQQESEKVVSPKTLTNGHLARCTTCAIKVKKGNTKAFAGRTHSDETKAKMRSWWNDQRVYGIDRSMPIRDEIERIIGGPVLNWETFQVTMNGYPPDYQDLLFTCQECASLSKQQFRGMPDVSPKCGTCLKKASFVRDDQNRYRSSYEVALEAFLKDHGVTVVTNHTGLIAPYDLDLFLPERNIAIEINGVYSHCEVFKNKDYHLMKTQRCEAVGVRLIHIFEDEWVYRQDIVKSRLLTILGKQQGPTIGARKCQVTTPDWREAMAFLKDHHIQGACQYTEGYALTHGGEMVAVMTFSKARVGIGSHAKDRWELLRFAVKRDHSVPGAASRLLAGFLAKHGPVPLHSFADRRWSVGNVYEKLGFKLLRTSAPGYCYVIKHRREHRFKYRKDRLVAQGEDPNLSEHEIMFKRKHYRIYDCGTLVYGMNC